jgi:hypothetical protein
MNLARQGPKACARWTRPPAAGFCWIRAPAAGARWRRADPASLLAPDRTTAAISSDLQNWGIRGSNNGDGGTTGGNIDGERTLLILVPLGLGFLPLTLPPPLLDSYRWLPVLSTLRPAYRSVLYARSWAKSLLERRPSCFGSPFRFDFWRYFFFQRSLLFYLSHLKRKLLRINFLVSLLIDSIIKNHS